MDAIQLLLLSVLVFGVGALASLLLNASSQISRYVAGIAGMLGSLAALAAAILSITNTVALNGQPATLELMISLPFGHFYLQMDGLSTLMVGMISVLGFAASLYSISYLKQHDNHNLGVLGFFTNLFIAMMLLVVTVANAFYFLVFWEMMTVASYFLVIFEGEKKEAIQAGYLYMLVAHAGAALIMVAFFLFFASSGSFDFAAFRQAQLPPALRNIIFLLAFIGFGAKAGMMPLHMWLPQAHPAAPSHISALLSGVMIKTAIYGILRVCVDILGASVLWWGVLVLFFGAISAILGVVFALVEHDLKRLLAYSSVENIGIILLGIGAGMIGVATLQPIVALLGFLAALYHALNHSFFKGLLFLGAGALDYRLGVRDLNKMGGLVKRMPWTGLAFLAGALAVTAIPPFNGFVSEWFTYQALFNASSDPNFVVRVFAPLCAVILALAGALAAMLYIKAYSSAFSGPAHSQAARQAQEAPGGMLASMFILVVGCLTLGLGAPLVAPYLARVAASFPGVTSMPVASSMWVFPAKLDQAVLSMPLIAILLLGLLTVPLILIALYGGFKAGRRNVPDPWTCGYGYKPYMSISASSFDQPMKLTFRSLYLLREVIQRPLEAIASWSKRFRETIIRVEPLIESWITRPTTRVVEYLGEHIQALQMGDIRVYCLYIILTLAVLLIVIFK